MKITFYGGAQMVTGSNYVLEHEGLRLMIDCGLFQCPGFCSNDNYKRFSYPVEKIDALIVTHAHLDHTGRIPKLVKEGFKGKIYSTIPTKEFASLMLEDSMGVLEKEAMEERRQPLYTKEDIERALALWETVSYDEPLMIGDLHVTFRNAGHVLGSAIVEVRGGGNVVLFSGDLGNIPSPLLSAHLPPKGITYMVLESTYGDREHETAEERVNKLERAIEDTINAGGTLMIPAFALERTQELLYEIHRLFDEGRVPKVPVFLDSPLAIGATAIFRRNSKFLSSELKALIRDGEDVFNFPGLRATKTSDESRSINEVRGPKIIIAGAGMMQGGRILHHAKRYLPDEKSTILFVGYAGAGTLARRLIEGAKNVIIHSEHIPVRARVMKINGYSAHADQQQLMEFVQSTNDTLKKVILVHGEPKSALFLSQRIRDYLGIATAIPKSGESIELL